MLELKPAPLTRCEQLAREHGLTGIGYWRVGDSGYRSPQVKAAEVEEVRSRIVPGWSRSLEAQAVVAFMRAGKPVEYWMGPARDRLDGEFLGTTCWAHGPWQYPEKWWRYIEKHSVRPWNEDFITDAVCWFNGTYLPNMLAPSDPASSTPPLPVVDYPARLVAPGSGWSPAETQAFRAHAARIAEAYRQLLLPGQPAGSPFS